MIVIFEKNLGDWDETVNFVDCNNRFVGFDTHKQCCENAGWMFRNKEGNAVVNPDLTTYDFEGPSKYTDVTYGEYAYKREAHFKLVSTDSQNQDIYLVLYNLHNGFYRHGVYETHVVENDRVDIPTRYI